MKRKTTLGVMLVIVAVGAMFAWQYNQESTGVVKKTSVVNEIAGANEQLKLFEGSNFETRIPENFRLRTTNTVPSGNVDSQYVFLSDTVPVVQIALTVGKTDGVLAEIPFVQQRSRNEANYRIETKGGEIRSYGLAENEFALFFENQNIYGAVVLTSESGNSTEPIRIAEEIKQNWIWR